MKKLLTLVVLTFLLFTACKSKKTKISEEGLFAAIETSKGTIIARLEYEKAPLTVTNFVGLAEGTISNNFRQKGQPFYDGLTFHRVVKDFVIQGGDPKGDGSGNPGYQFPDEFHPDLKHDRAGILSMANAGPHTNGCQFFITLKPSPHLDRVHSAFGQVVQGIEILEKIEQNDKIISIKIIRNGERAKSFHADDTTFQKLIAKASEQIEQELKQKAEEEDKIIAEKFPQAQQTPSGLRFIILRPGKGEKPKRGDIVRAHYIGTLLNGNEFDNSYKRNQPIEFPVGVGRVIPGWDEALLEMQKGEKRQLIIPFRLAYGGRGAGGIIPPYATLIFEVELIEIQKPNKQN